MRADRHLYLDRSRTRLVGETDLEVAWMLAGKGQEIDPGEVRRLKLVVHEGRVMQQADVPAPEPVAVEPEPEMVEGYEPNEPIMPPKVRRSRRKY